jgi:hypothetical protein
MSAALLAIQRDTQSIGASITRTFAAAQGPLRQEATEVILNTTWHKAGVMSNLYVRILTNNRPNNSTLIGRHNTADGNLTATITASTTGEFEDTTNSDTLADGDEYNLQLTTGAGGSQFTLSIMSVLFNATSDTYSRHIAIGSASTASTTHFVPLSTSYTATTTEADAQALMKSSGTMKHLWAYVTTNGRGTTSTIGSRKNAGAGNLTASISAGTTGVFEDTSNSDSYVSDDLLNWYITLGTGTGTLEVWMSAGMETTNGTVEMLAHEATSGQAVLAGATGYFPISGRTDELASESAYRCEVNYAPTASKARVYISANTIVETSTLAFRIDGGSGNQAVSVTGLTTGWFSDGSNSDVLSATNEVNWQLVVGATGTSLTLQALAVLMTVATGVTINPGVGEAIFDGLQNTLGFGVLMPHEPL